MSAPSPIPPDLRVDRSGGLRVSVSHHAVKRYTGRALRLGEETLAGVPDRDAVEVLATWGYRVQAYRDRLAYFGGVQLRYRADGVVIDGIRLVLDGELVVTVVDSRMPAPASAAPSHGELHARADWVQQRPLFLAEAELNKSVLKVRAGLRISKGLMFVYKPCLVIGAFSASLSLIGKEREQRKVVSTLGRRSSLLPVTRSWGAYSHTDCFWLNRLCSFF